MKLILLCFCAFAALQVVIGSSAESLCNRRTLFAIPRNRYGINWISFQKQASIAQATLCLKINTSTDPNVKTSALNILNNIDDLCGATATMAREIVSNCKSCNNRLAAKITVADITERIGCFNAVLGTTDADNSVANLGACVEASTTKASNCIAVRAPECQEVVNSVQTSALAPIQSYYADPSKFLVDLPRVVQSNCS